MRSSPRRGPRAPARGPGPPPPRGPRWPAGLSLAGVLLLFLSLAVQQIWNADIWWQLGTGRWILEHKALPAGDVFSYTAAGWEWIELRWLFAVLAHAGFALGGAPLLILAQTTVLAAAFWFVVWPVRRTLEHPAAVAVLALGVAAASDRFVVRPELVTFLFVPLFLDLLAGFRRGERPRRAWLLPPLQVLWVNAHTLFVFGPLLTWGHAAGSVVQPLLDRRAGRITEGGGASIARQVALGLAVTAACFINPWGHRGAFFPWTLYKEIQPGSILARSIQEFRSPFALPGWGGFVWAAAALALVSALTFVLNWRRVDVTRLGVWLAFLYLAGVSTRNLGLFGLVATWAALHNLDALRAESPRASPRRSPRSALARPVHATLAALLVAAAWYVASDRYFARLGDTKRFGLGIIEDKFPVAATSFLLASGARPQLFHDLGDGGYLIWAAPERFPVYVDGRLEVYGERFLAEYLSLLRRDWTSPGEWDAFASGLGIRTVMLNRALHGRLLEHLRRSPHWPLVHIDPRNVVFVRDLPEHAELIARHRVDLTRPWIPPADDGAPQGWRRWIGSVGSPWGSFEMAKTFLVLGAPENAARCLEHGIGQFPAHIEMRWTLAAVYRSLGRDADASRVMAGVVLDPATAQRAQRLLVQLRRLNDRSQPP